LERDLDEVRDRLEPELDRLAPLAPVDPERLEADPERFADDPAREDDDRGLPDRDELERLDPDLEPERLVADLEPELLARDAVLRDPLEGRLEPFDERRARVDEERRELDRGEPLRRSAAGISSLATAFASCGICFSRNLAIRSSSRRMPRATFAVSLSLTASASASMPV